MGMTGKACDRPLLGLTIVLALFGLAIVYSASAVISIEMTGNPHHFFVKHLASLGLGFILMMGVMRIDYRTLSQPRAVYAIVLLLLGLLVVVLLTPMVHNTHRWFRLGAFTFQPSEFSKIAVVIFLAYMLAKKADELNEVRTSLAPMGAIVGLFAVLILVQPDMGTAFNILAIGAILLFLAGMRFRYMVAVACVSVPVFVKLILMEEWRRQRFLAFLNPLADPKGYGFQPIQALIAVGSGGIFGAGPGAGRQKLFFLPEPHTDFVYAVIGEELGLIGTMAVLAAFLLLLWRGVRIALRAPDAFGFYLAAGLTSLLVFQGLFNMSVVLSLVPTKGIPLPLISTGGSSLIVTFLAVGLLLSVSQRTES